MGASCKGICIQMKHSSIPNSKKYELGLKRCSWCEVFMATEEIRCPCCKMILRTKSRNKKKLLSRNNTDNSTDTNFQLHRINSRVGMFH